jgi:putative ABC transport system permease protein
MMALKFLRWFCKPEYLVDVEGDLREMHDKRVKQVGLQKANLLLWRDVIFLFRPGMIRSLVPAHKHNVLAVTHHNILISLRNFARNKTAFFINLGSLTSGLVCALLIYLWVADEISMDKFHENNERIYYVTSTSVHPDGVTVGDYTPSPLRHPGHADLLPGFVWTGSLLVRTKDQGDRSPENFRCQQFKYCSIAGG